MTVDKLRFNLGNTNYDVPTKEYVDSRINASSNSSTRGDIYNINSIGTITYQYTLLRNHLKLDGTSVKASDYQKLLNFVINNNLTGTSEQYINNKALFVYDETNDILTLPNFLDKTVWGGNFITEKTAGLPNITGYHTFLYPTDWGNPGGAFKRSGITFNRFWADTSGESTDVISFDASLSNATYGNSNTVQPPAIQLIPQIRYEEDIIKTSDSSAIGSIVGFMAVTAPTSYLSCDGTVYNIEDYQQLANFFYDQFGMYNKFGGNGTTTFAVPDLRGEFLRGTGTNSHVNNGDGNNVGMHQDGTKFPAVQVWSDNTSNSGSASMLGDFKEGVPYNPSDNIDFSFRQNRCIQISYNGKKDSYETTNRLYAYTSRPTNTSVLYCIKYI